MKSFNCLDPSQEIAKPYFLEASAGTGKTFAIEHIFVRLLLQKKEAISCKNILVVTFTNAATRELRLRIYQTLEDSYRQIQTDSYSFPYLKNLSKEEKTDYLAILEKAKLEFEEAQIFTIHGFCFYCLKTHGIEANILLDGVELSKNEAGSLLKEIVLDTLRADIKDSDIGISQLKQLLKKFRGNIEKLVNKIASLLEKQIPYKEGKSFSELTEDFFKAIEKLKREIDIDVFANSFEKVCLCYKDLASRQNVIKDFVHKQQEMLLSCLKEEPTKELFETLLLESAYYLESIEEGNRKIKAPFLEEEKLFYQVKKILLPVFEEAKEENLILLNLLKICAKRIKETGNEEEIFSFDEYLKIMLKALSQDSFREKIQNLYQAAIVDEFQDTDPLQWKIFKTLFVKDHFPLFLVGDPKQSIYAFRNADLPTYIEAGSCFSKENHFSLDTNYRSEPSLIHTLNTLFCEENAKNWLSKDSKIVYQKVKAADFSKDSYFADGGKSVHAVILEEKKSKEKQFPPKALEEEKLFPYIAKEILQLKEKQNISFKEVAILVKDRFQMQRLQQAFLKLQIPILTKSMILLSETKAYDFLHVLFSILVGAEEKSSLRKVLMHPFVGISYKDILLEAPTKRGTHSLLELQKLKKIYQEEGFLSFWESFLQTEFKEKISFEKNLLSQEKKEDYFDLMQLIELIFSKVHPPYLIEDVLFFLESLQEENGEDLEKMQRGIQKEDAVCVMTTHVSKGLEFPFVFALGIVNRFSSKEPIIKKEEGFEVYDEKDKEHKKIIQNLNEEKMRQLYVALTRAKKRVYLFFCLGDDTAEEIERSPMELFAYFLCKSYRKEDLIEKLNSLSLTNLKIDLLEELLQVHKSKEEEPNIILSKPQNFSRKIREKIFSSYSSLAKPKEILYEENEIIEQPLLPSSKETGNILHAILEKVFERGLQKNFEEKEIRLLVEKEVQGTKYKLYQELLFELVDLACHIEFKVEGKVFNFSQISIDHIMTEMPFYLYWSKEETIKGFIDLCFIHDHKLYLLDWKSNFLSGYEKETLFSCMEKEDYLLQAEIYTEAIKAFLDKNKKSYSYGGMFYVFLRGLKKGEADGIYFIKGS